MEDKRERTVGKMMKRGQEAPLSFFVLGKSGEEMGSGWHVER